MPSSIKTTSRQIKTRIEAPPLDISNYRDLSKSSRRIEDMLSEWRQDNARKSHALTKQLASAPSDARHSTSLSAASDRIEELLGEWSLSNARRARELVQENLSLKQAIFDLAEDNAQLKRLLRKNPN